MSNNFSRPTRVLPWTNPITRPSGSAPTTSLVIPRVVGGALSDSSTTDTTNGMVVFSQSGTVPGAALWLVGFLQCHVKHSVANASVRVTVELYNGPTTADTPAFTVWGAVPHLSPTAEAFSVISETVLLYFAPTSWTPGERLLVVRVTPVTAGTVTTASSSTAYSQFHVFVLGGIQ